MSTYITPSRFRQSAYVFNNNLFIQTQNKPHIVYVEWNVFYSRLSQSIEIMDHWELGWINCASIISFLCLGVFDYGCFSSGINLTILLNSAINNNVNLIWMPCLTASPLLIEVAWSRRARLDCPGRPRKRQRTHIVSWQRPVAEYGTTRKKNWKHNNISNWSINKNCQNKSHCFAHLRNSRPSTVFPVHFMRFGMCGYFARVFGIFFGFYILLLYVSQNSDIRAECGYSAFTW